MVEYLLGAGVVYGLHRIRQIYKESTLKRAWAEVAGALEERFDPVEGWHVNKMTQLAHHVDGQPLLIELYEHRPTEDSAVELLTRIQTINAVTNELTLSLTKEKTGVTGAVRKAFSEDVSVGSPHFDAHFEVKTNDPGLCRAWLAQDTQESLLIAGEYSFVLDGIITTTRKGIEDDPEQLINAAVATAALANGGARLRERLQQTFPDGRATLSPGKAFQVEETSLSWPHQQMRCTLRFSKAHPVFQPKRSLMTCLQIQHLSQGAVLSLTPTDALNQLPPELQGELRQLPCAGLSSDERAVSLWLSGFVHEQETVQRACEVLSFFVRGRQGGPYR